MNFDHCATTSRGTLAYPYPGRSTRSSSGFGWPALKFTVKKLIICVRPGVLLTRAIVVPTSEFSRLDLPTFERPRKAISGAPGAGKCAASTADVRNLVMSFTD